MKIRHKPRQEPHLRPIFKTNQGAGHPLVPTRKPHPDSKYFNVRTFRPTPPKRKKKK